MAVPLYYRIYRDLQSRICSGSYPPGSRLPREQDLEEIYGTSRAPVRQALSSLEKEGFIVRRPGKGTFVTHRTRSHPWLSATGFVKCYEQHWKAMTCRTLVAQLRPPPQEARDFLQLPPDQKGIYMVRLQLLQDRPAMILEYSLSPQVDLKTIQNAGDFMSLKELLDSRAGIELRSSKERLALRPLPQELADVAQLPTGSAVLRVYRFMTDQFNRPLLFCAQYLLNQDWEYEVTFDLPQGAPKLRNSVPLPTAHFNSEQER